jgi:predicted CXXCH cytochrome family protein
MLICVAFTGTRHSDLYINSVQHSLSHAIFAMGICLCVITGSSAIAAEKDSVWNAKDILGSKHDLTSLNQRAGVEAMAGVAFNDYENPCVYCHLPAEDMIEEGEANGGITGWNRIRPVSKQYETYYSASLQGTVKRPSDISMLCLSCHDGTVAVDRIVFKPLGWNTDKQATLHMKLGAENDINHCGKCHDGDIAHNINVKTIGTDLRDDHPISIRYAGLAVDNPNFRTVDGPRGFDNGVMLYDGMVECASCHDIHNPQATMLLRAEPSVLCGTCHIK